MNETTPQQPGGRRVGKNILTCAGIFVAALFLVGIIAAYLVAESGLVRVPLFSSTFFSGTQATRVVEAEEMTREEILGILSRRYGNAVLRGETPPHHIPLSESELTALLRDLLGEPLRQNGLQSDELQAVILPSGVEVTAALTGDRLTYHLRLQIDPTIADGALGVTISQMVLGDLPIHPGLANDLASSIVSRDVGTWTVRIGDEVIQDVVLHDGTLELIIHPQE